MTRLGFGGSVRGSMKAGIYERKLPTESLLEGSNRRGRTGEGEARGPTLWAPLTKVACGVRGAHQPEQPRWMMHEQVMNAAGDAFGSPSK